jgi:hypothetical protein
VAWGRDSTYAEVASGCEEIIVKAPMVQEDASKTLVVTIEDKRMRLVGKSFPVDLALDLDASMARLASIAQSQAEAVFPSAQNGEAKAYLDIAHDVLMAQNQAAKAATLQSQITAGTIQSLADVLSANKAGIASTAAALSTLLTSVGKNLSVQANYGVGAVGVPMTLTVGALLARSEDGSLAFDLMAISGDMAPTATIAASFDDARAEVDVQTLSIALGLGNYGRALLDALGKDDAKWTVTRFAGAAGCTAVANWLAQNASVSDGGAPLCDKACSASVCSEVTSRVVAAARTGFSVQLDGEHPAISLTGKLSAHDRAGDESVDDLGPSPVSGNWGKSKASDTEKEDAVTGELKSMLMDEGTLTL